MKQLREIHVYQLWQIHVTTSRNPCNISNNLRKIQQWRFSEWLTRQGNDLIWSGQHCVLSSPPPNNPKKHIFTKEKHKNNPIDNYQWAILPLSRRHHVSWEALICKHKQIQWAIGWKIIVFNLLSRPPEPDFIEASRLIAGLLVGKLAFDEVWCQGAAKFPSNYLLARAPQLFTFRTQHVDQTTSYNQRDEFIIWVVITVLNEWSCLVLS